MNWKRKLGLIGLGAFIGLLILAFLDQFVLPRPVFTEMMRWYVIQLTTDDSVVPDHHPVASEPPYDPSSDPFIVKHRAINAETRRSLDETDQYLERSRLDREYSNPPITPEEEAEWNWEMVQKAEAARQEHQQMKAKWAAEDRHHDALLREIDQLNDNIRKETERELGK